MTLVLGVVVVSVGKPADVVVVPASNGVSEG